MNTSTFITSVPCGDHARVDLDADGGATVHVTGQNGDDLRVRVTAAQIENFAYLLNNALGDTR